MMDIQTIFNFAKDLIATVLTLLMMLSPAFDSTGAKYTAEKPEELVASFAVVSDIHVETNNPTSFNNFKAVLEGIKGGEDVDAAVYTGDNVMNGQLLENLFFYLGIRGVMPAEKNFAVMGNHDIGNGTGDYLDHKNNFITNNRLFLGNNVGEGYYYRVVNGCYMIFLSLEDLTVNTSIMSEEQLNWFAGVLDEAKAKNAPIVVFNHHPINYLEGVPADSLINLCKGYDKLIYVHGHIHDDLGEDNFYNVGGVDCINLPRCTETVDYAAGDGIVIEVYENEIVVRGRDFIKGEWIEGLRYSY
ncbi:MAG: metallophosphoesterase [Ruminococcaceae bacterium]|nr:metallophosphoesterase [Oscillospiraceae bacterium]